MCDHSRSHAFFKESITGLNKFRAKKCKKFLKKCHDTQDVYMGGYPGNRDKGVEGVFYLSTNKKPPFGKG